MLNPHLQSLLELNLSKPAKKSSIKLGVSESGLASSIKSALNIDCDASERSLELIRGIRLHATKLLKGLQDGDLVKAQLGLGHSYSRAKVKFNVNRMDNMIIQAIALLDQLDKDVNLFAMRIREWYGYHFPELVKIVPDNHQYAKVAQFIGNKEELTEAKLPDLAVLLDDDTTKAQNILDAARGSMGASLSEIDMLNISAFAMRVVSIAEYRKSLTAYLTEKMNLVAPSLTALLGERIGARLISHAGSLTNLSKYPASTVQILGAEKALFRALKTKGNTPKVHNIFYYNLFFLTDTNCSMALFIIQLSSGVLALNIKVASRDSWPTKHLLLHALTASPVSYNWKICPGQEAQTFPTDNPTAKFGDALRNQVEERLAFFETGAAPSKNADAMRKVLEQMQLDDDEGSDADMADVNVPLTLLEPSPQKKKDKKEKGEKKKKKRKIEAMEVDEPSDDEKESKKAKLSKEEKKEKRKKEKKEKAKDGDKVSANLRQCLCFFTYHISQPEKEKKEKKKKSKPANDSDTD